MVLLTIAKTDLNILEPAEIKNRENSKQGSILFETAFNQSICSQKSSMCETCEILLELRSQDDNK